MSRKASLTLSKLSDRSRPLLPQRDIKVHRCGSFGARDHLAGVGLTGIVCPTPRRAALEARLRVSHQSPRCDIDVGLMWGVPGAILATPMLAITKIICDRIRPLMAFGHFIEG